MTNSFLGRSLLLAAGLFAVAAATDSGTAEAGRFRVHWGGGVRVNPSVNIRYNYARPVWRPHRWNVTGQIYIGPTYTYRPYYYYYQPEYVPSYYGSSYYPVQPAASVGTSTAIVVAPRPELPRFGVGLFAGGASVENRGDSSGESSDVGVLGRFRLSGGLLLEGELGKTSYEENLRVDRRLGASLVYEIGAYNKWAPYVLAGLGVQEAETNGNYNTDQSYAEIGGGIRWAITPQFHLTADLRLGSRATMSNDEVGMDTLGTKARTVAPPTTNDSEDPSEEYTRGRVSAILYF